MPPLAYTALIAAIVLSALGAIVICGLTALYGFTSAGEEPPGRAARRMLLTRVGHAVAAGCFAATAMLLAVVLSQPARPARTSTGDGRAPALDTKLDAQMQRLDGVEQRMKDSEQTLERLEAEISDVTARRMGAAPEPPAPAKVEEKPAPAAKPAPRSRTSAATTKPVSTAKPVSTPKAVATPKPADAKPPAPVEHPVAVTLPPERVVAPPPSTPPAERAFAPKPPDEPAASPGGSAASTSPVVSASPTPPAATPSARALAPRSTEPPPGNDLRSKFRNDWQSIQRGWDRAADDFKRAVAPLRGD